MKQTLNKEVNTNTTTHESKVNTFLSDTRKHKENFLQSLSADDEIELKQRKKRNKYYNDLCQLLDSYDQIVEEKNNKINELKVEK